MQDVLSIAASVIGESPDADVPLMHAGVTSVAAVRLSSRLRSLTGLALPPTLIFEWPTPRAIAAHLADSNAPAHLAGAEALVASIKDELGGSGRGGAVAVSRASSVSPTLGVPLGAQLPVSSLQRQLI